MKDLIMARFISNEARLRDTALLIQDFMGLDFDVGSIVFVPELNRQYRCIKQTVDYNKFQVRSELLETFPTRYSSAPTVIWDYINDADAPIGSTLLTDMGSDMHLDLEIGDVTPGLDWWYQIYVSKDGGAWEELASFTANTGPLIETFIWSGDTATVEVLIRGADDDGSGGQSFATPFVPMHDGTS